MSIDSESRSIILEATTLRAQGKYREAIEHIRRNFDRIDPDLRFNARKEIFEAAKGLGDMPLVRQTAQEIALEHPDLPSIQDYL
jgi:hypothetical protein